VPPRTWVWDEPAPGHYQQQATQNGYYTWVLVRDGHWDATGSTFIPQVGTAARTTTTYSPYGIWAPESKGYVFKVAQCPSDPSPGSDPEVRTGLVYTRTQDPPWGSTNYLANWWALSTEGTIAFWNSQRPPAGWFAPPKPFRAVGDGLTNTILFAEGYAWCDGIGRIALYPPGHHNFTLTPGMTGASNQVQIDGQLLDIGRHDYGYPNTWRFQVRPRALGFNRCPQGEDCCNRWVAQTPHAAMNVALLDGSVRAVVGSVSTPTWSSALLPSDGLILGPDW
jgi:hypothetical protein